MLASVMFCSKSRQVKCTTYCGDCGTLAHIPIQYKTIINIVVLTYSSCIQTLHSHTINTSMARMSTVFHSFTDMFSVHVSIEYIASSLVSGDLHYDLTQNTIVFDL